ncbi:MAG: hypothetical protein ACRDBG_02790, partial [Waterburya sp.]
MNLAELQAEVITITKRPDRVAETLLAVRSATLFMHQTDFYFKDLFESSIIFTPGAYFHQVDYIAQFPRFRSLNYIRKFDPTGTPAPGIAKEYLEVIQPTDVLDSLKVNKTDICYIAGAFLQIRSSTVITNALIGIYNNPD